jgi:hypothetical protein
MIKRAILVCSACAVAVNSVEAQDDRIPGGVLGLVRVLSDDAVKSELMLDKDQVVVAVELADLLGRVRDGKAQAMASERLKKSLSEEQLERLEQIHWQRLGARAIHERKVRQGLGLTDEQQKKLQEVKALNDAEHRKMLDFLRRARFRSREAMEKYKQEYLDAATGRLLGILTVAQREKLKEMAGKPFAPEA